VIRGKAAIVISAVRGPAATLAFPERDVVVKV
jgi:hypothetical protein